MDSRLEEQKTRKLEALVEQKDQQIADLEAARIDDQELAEEVASLAQMLQKTQETLKVVAEENSYLKETVGEVY